MRIKPLRFTKFKGTVRPLWTAQNPLAYATIEKSTRSFNWRVEFADGDYDRGYGEKTLKQAITAANQHFEKRVRSVLEPLPPPPNAPQIDLVKIDSLNNSYREHRRCMAPAPWNLATSDGLIVDKDSKVVAKANFDRDDRFPTCLFMISSANVDLCDTIDQLLIYIDWLHEHGTFFGGVPQDR